ncbi:DUF7336 domain-containing protein [Dyella sp. 2RAB6]|uniref:DUF7336 domain-containing protein n=1 Tax=Dyella sp. 2RAB6 TaxID=3232992 RepID=UPI003F9079E2
MRHVLPVNFNNADADGVVRLNTRGVLKALGELSWALTEGAEVFITDGEIHASAVVQLSDGIWIARVTQWLDEPFDTKRETLCEQKIYLLQHCRKNADREDDYKMIGAYGTAEAAEEAMARAVQRPVFKDYPDDFQIVEYVLGQDHWVDGFFVWTPDSE